MSVPIGQIAATTQTPEPALRPTPRSRERADEASGGPAATRETVERATSDLVRAELERTGEIAFGERRIEFAFDESADRVVVKIRDADSDEIVRQLPPDDFLKFIARFREQIGILFDEQA